MKEDILKLFDEPFAWDSFVKNLDLQLPSIIRKYCDYALGDLRITVYALLVYDLVTEWYRVLVYAESRAEIDILYQNGREALRQVVDELQWPVELDAF